MISVIVLSRWIFQREIFLSHISTSNFVASRTSMVSKLSELLLLNESSSVRSGAESLAVSIMLPLSSTLVLLLEEESSVTFATESLVLSMIFSLSFPSALLPEEESSVSSITGSFTISSLALLLLLSAPGALSSIATEVSSTHSFGFSVADRCLRLESIDALTEFPHAFIISIVMPRLPSSSSSILVELSVDAIDTIVRSNA
mmetsp:Transcript_26186/g.61519  ORF Transcript_26186/g.61519 Transcript_26186/m.61519 type:complete len:202 (+) Transcript_26186:1629-2234(+)